MFEDLAERIKDHVLSKQCRTIPFASATQKDIEEAEERLGFRIPEVLRSIYTIIGNGGFGPGRGGTIIGVKGGYVSNVGDIVAEYEEMKKGARYLGLEWPSGVLPFCEWGCNIFSCVGCIDQRDMIYNCEECNVNIQKYTIIDFMQMWLQDVDILSIQELPRTSVAVINPFTGKKTHIKGRPQR